ncbi:DUF6463 family protein [Nonomuraea sp. NPDC048826]|uniref:DUF6463 family protein n=1 Tax=Nonomuraea sp. NPDC048826 TaxID=3364347 RepID=UPI003712E5C1
MVKWAGWLILLIGLGHTIGGLVLTAPDHADAWFSRGLWGEDLAAMSPAHGAYWLAFGSFGPPQVVIGLMVLWLDRRGMIPPPFIAWILAINAVLCGVIFGPAPWPVDLISAGLLLTAARRSARSRRLQPTAAKAPAAPVAADE